MDWKGRMEIVRHSVARAQLDVLDCLSFDCRYADADISARDQFPVGCFILGLISRYLISTHSLSYGELGRSENTMLVNAVRPAGLAFVSAVKSVAMPQGRRRFLTITSR